MSGRVLAWAWGQAGLGAREKLVLVCLADLADASGRVCRSIAALGERCAMSASAVQRALRRLKLLGLVEQRRRPNRAAVYELVMGAVEGDASGDGRGDASMALGEVAGDAFGEVGSVVGDVSGRAGSVAGDASGDVAGDVSHRISDRISGSDRSPPSPPRPPERPPPEDEQRLMLAGAAFVHERARFAASACTDREALTALVGDRRLDARLTRALVEHGRTSPHTVDALIAGLRWKAAPHSRIEKPAGILRWAIRGLAIDDWAASAAGCPPPRYDEARCDDAWTKHPPTRLAYDPDDPSFAPCLT